MEWKMSSKGNRYLKAPSGRMIIVRKLAGPMITTIDPESNYSHGIHTGRSQSKFLSDIEMAYKSIGSYSLVLAIALLSIDSSMLSTDYGKKVEDSILKIQPGLKEHYGDRKITNGILYFISKHKKKG